MGDETEAATWEAVAADLSRVARGVRHLSGPLRRGALHLRLAVLGLRRSLARNHAGLFPGDATEAGPTLDLLEVALEAQLSGGTPSHPVLERLPTEDRAAAVAEIARALEADPDYKPALRAAAALAQADESWTQALAYYQRIADLPGMPETLVDALQRMGQLHWRKLGDARTAHGLLQRARELQPDDLVLVDQLLKLDLELERWEDAVAGCQHLLGHLGRNPANPELSVTYLLTLGEIHCYGLKNPAAALGFYLDAVERLPEYPLTFSLMQDLIEAHGDSALSGLAAENGGDNARRRQIVDLLRGAVNRHQGAQAAMRAFKDAVGFAAGL